MRTVVDLWRGIGVPPVVTGFVRGGVEAALIAAAAALYGYLMGDVLPAFLPDGSLELAVAAGVVRLGWRTLEGWIDQIDPARARAADAARRTSGEAA